MTIPHSKPTLGKEEQEAVAAVIASGRIAQGEQVAAFEEECAALLRRKYAVAVNSGTAALHLALSIYGKPGDTVHIPSYACASLQQAAGMAGLKPHLCDCDRDFITDVGGKKQGLRVAVHLFGATTPVQDGHLLIEDLAQGMGGKAGRKGTMAVTSFYATKMMTTGEGGMVFTDDLAVAHTLRDRRDYDNRDDAQQRHAYKMTDMQAAMGREQLKKLPAFVQRRRDIAEYYDISLVDLPVQLPRGEGHVYFRYVIATPDRDGLMRHLHQQGIEAKLPVHRPAHHFLGGMLPQAERAHKEALSLPIYPSLTDAEVERVVKSVRGWYAQKGHR